MFGLDPKDLIIIIAVLILLFGSKFIPELGKNIAEAIRNLRKGLKDSGDEDTQQEQN